MSTMSAREYLFAGFRDLCGKMDAVQEEQIAAVCERLEGDLAESYVNIVGVAKAIQLKVYAASLLDGISGMLKRHEREIYLEESEPHKRRRFTCAHEIGHFILHNTEAHDVMLLRSKTTDEIEKQANTMAAEILMPRYFVKRFLEENNNLQDEELESALAERFLVSDIAARYRITNIRQYKQFEKYRQ